MNEELLKVEEFITGNWPEGRCYIIESKAEDIGMCKGQCIKYTITWEGWSD
ncbi:MAG: hypothetical protein R2685_10520 [Candidatus Nitrosocosmicus sp.]|nr:hypothetical protein [Candidatus Nitrosocosmicus sp.]